MPEVQDVSHAACFCHGFGSRAPNIRFRAEQDGRVDVALQRHLPPILRRASPRSNFQSTLTTSASGFCEALEMLRGALGKKDLRQGAAAGAPRSASKICCVAGNSKAWYSLGLSSPAQVSKS